jgi:hypothetical protein
MAENDPDILAQFQDFLKQKEEADKAANAEEDFEVEIWGPDGSGVRTRRSHAGPFLQKLGLDMPAEPPGDDPGEGDKKTGKAAPKGKTAANAANGNTARRYFTKPPAGK